METRILDGMQNLITWLQKRGVLHSQNIIKALQEIDRALFVPAALQSAAYEDTALPIAAGQTISQPYTVVFMIEQLQVRPGDRVLDIGYGSGWQTALLAHLVGQSGRVHAFEIVPELCAIGEKNLAKYPQLASRVELICRSAKDGYPEAAPFDRIIAAAEVKEVPRAWREQLAPGGRMLYPKGNAIVLEIEGTDGAFEIQRFPGFVFVPFV